MFCSHNTTGQNTGVDTILSSYSIIGGQYISKSKEHLPSSLVTLNIVCPINWRRQDQPKLLSQAPWKRQASSFRIPEFLLQHHIITRLQPTETYDRCRYDLVKDTSMCFNTVFDVDLVCSAV